MAVLEGDAFGGFSETTGFLAGSAAWTATMEGVGRELGLGPVVVGKEDWLSLVGEIKDLVGMRELAVKRAIEIEVVG